VPRSIAWGILARAQHFDLTRQFITIGSSGDETLPLLPNGNPKLGGQSLRVNNKKPRPAGLPGVWRRVLCPCRRVRRGERSRPQCSGAIDCSEGFPGLVTRWCPNESGKQRVNPERGADKQIFSITPVRVIAAPSGRIWLIAELNAFRPRSIVSKWLVSHLHSASGLSLIA
jgi:hypothetical protein